jgi:hypothetical protein
LEALENRLYFSLPCIIFIAKPTASYTTFMYKFHSWAPTRKYPAFFFTGEHN